MKKKIVIALVVLLLAIQLIPVDRSNPPVTSPIDAPGNVVAILERACYDCHSNATVWPWYSRFAPMSLLISRDVEEAREHLNFSEWDKLSEEKRAHAIEEIWSEVEEGEMPLWFYTPLHPEAELSSQDRAVLKAWSDANGDATADLEDESH